MPEIPSHWQANCGQLAGEAITRRVVFAGARQSCLIPTELADDASDLPGSSPSGPFLGPAIASANGTDSKPVTRIDVGFLQHHLQLECRKRDCLSVDCRKLGE